LQCDFRRSRVRGVHKGVQKGVQETNGRLQITPINMVPIEDRHRLMPRNGHNTEVINPGASWHGHEGMSEIVNGGVGHASLGARPLKCMRDAGGMVARVHLLRVRLPGTHHGQVDEHSWTAHVSCSSFERACQCLVQRDEAPASVSENASYRGGIHETSRSPLETRGQVASLPVISLHDRLGPGIDFPQAACYTRP
jgi:hypothetical protein